jgi:prepilin-type N-terminal cleavage/methylation domain-containing protein
MFPKAFRGFSLIELIISISIIAIILSIAIPSYRSINQEAKVTKTTAHLEILNDAVQSFYLKYNKLPNNITEDLISDHITNQVLQDPFKTIDINKKYTFGYELFDNKYYIIYSYGFDKKKNWTWDNINFILNKNKGDDIIVSNTRIKK